jgi:hypothetical protein
LKLEKGNYEMSISYKLYKNHLTNGANNYRAIVHYTGSIDLNGVIDRMIARGSTITRADALAVLEDYHETITELALQGFKVITPTANYGLSLKGNFTGQTDGYDPSRHRPAAQVSPGVQFRQAVESRAHLEKQESTLPHPRLLEYNNLNNGDGDGVLTPGGMARLSGHRLKFDPADPEQGLLLMAADRTTTRVEVIGRNTPNELIFMTPPGLAPGQYTLMVRARFGQNSVRIGLFEDMLTVT